MFKRRHPFLYFLLVSFAIGASALVLFSFIMAWAIKDPGHYRRSAIGIVEITDELTRSDHIVMDLARFRGEDRIKAVVLRVDSPGGPVAPAQEIYKEVMRTAEKKPVVASFGSVAASGGYYASAGADGIMANPGTITGSIGVVMFFMNMKGLLDKVGVTPVVLKAGKNKDMDYLFRELDKSEIEMLQKQIESVHIQFKQAVAQGRHLSMEAVDALADGRAFTGEQAKELGLVDRLGNFRDAIVWAADLAGIKSEYRIEYAREARFPFFLDLLMQSSAAKMIKPFTMAQTPGIYYLYQPGL